ncbi:MAG: nuclear transport factor 2 family protein [Curvibacter sp.]
MDYCLLGYYVTAAQQSRKPADQGEPMLDKPFVDHFAAQWIAAWNAHDLSRILAHYADDFEMSSPYIAQLFSVPSGTLKGKQAVEAYWHKALERMPTLRFELVDTLVGVNSVVLYYRGARGMAAEVFEFNAAGRVTRAAAHYAT